MQDNEFKGAVDEILKDVDFSQIYEGDDEQEDQVNFWIPVEYKAKYKIIQDASKKRFSKLMKELIMKCIDRAAEAKKAA